MAGDHPGKFTVVYFPGQSCTGASTFSSGSAFTASFQPAGDRAARVAQSAGSQGDGRVGPRWRLFPGCQRAHRGPRPPGVGTPVALLRPPFAADRLEEIDDRRLIYHLPKPSLDGQTPIVLSPLELIGRIAALVPPPRQHRHRYYGVLAPNSPLRPVVTALAPGR
jgi:hypothetical protein